MLSSILKLVFLSQLIILSESLEQKIKNCKIFEGEVKQKTKATLVPGSGIYTIGFYTDVSSFLEDENINFYLEINKEDLTRSTDKGKEEITPSTYAYFTDDVMYEQNTRECYIDSLSQVSPKSSSSDYSYVKYDYNVVYQKKNIYMLLLVLPVKMDFKIMFFFI